ncbi:MAG: DUF427 domain-containing protein [Acidimicrobiales bacterium]
MSSPRREEPAPGQESVWDYPRPPRLESTSSRVVVEFAGATIADTTAAYRVLETSQPPGFYLPPTDIAVEHLRPTTNRTFCEWKGLAHYYSVVVGDRVAPEAAWAYARPTPAFAAIADYVAFYPQLMDRCTVDGEVVEPNQGSFYGGWITSKVVGPFKGGPGTVGW